MAFGTYTVTWTIEVEANSSYEAACLAHKMQVEPDTTATVYKVTGPDDHVEEWDVS